MAYDLLIDKPCLGKVYPVRAARGDVLRSLEHENYCGFRQSRR